MAYQTEQQAIIIHDRKFDDLFIGLDQEPEAAGIDNCQQEGKKVITAIKLDTKSSDMDEQSLLEQRSIKSPQKSVVSRRQTKLSKSINTKQFEDSANKTSQSISKKSTTRQNLSQLQQQLALSQLKQLNEEEWRKPHVYQDGLSDRNLDNLRKFVIKKREFNDSQNNEQKSTRNNRNSIIGNQTSSFLNQNPGSQLGLIFERNGFLKNKRVNPESLPRISQSFNDTSFKPSDTTVIVDNSNHFNKLKKTIEMMKTENDKRKLIEQERLQQEEMIRNYAANKMHLQAQQKKKQNQSKDQNTSDTNNLDSSSVQQQTQQDEEEEEEDEDQVIGTHHIRNISEIQINQVELETYNPKKKLISLIANADLNTDPKKKQDEKEPEKLSMNYGVTYQELGSLNSNQVQIKYQGKDFKEHPENLNRMRKLDLERIQSMEQTQILERLKVYNRNSLNQTISYANQSSTSFMEQSFINKTDVNPSARGGYMKISELLDQQEDKKQFKLSLPEISTKHLGHTRNLSNSHSNTTKKRYDKILNPNTTTAAGYQQLLNDQSMMNTTSNNIEYSFLMNTNTSLFQQSSATMQNENFLNQTSADLNLTNKNVQFSLQPLKVIPNRTLRQNSMFSNRTRKF
eukprot:403347189